MQLHLAFPPKDVYAAASIRADAVYMIYRAGRDGHLYRAETGTAITGGIMAIDDGGAPFSGSPVLLAGEVVREAVSHGFSGVMLNISENLSTDACELAALLDSECSSRGLSLYVPEPLAEHAQSAVILIETSISEGTLSRKLSETVSRFGAQRTALDIERVCMDFTLPNRSGAGKRLSISEMRTLIARTGAKVFFSRELCAWYFNYNAFGKAHFVLFDDAESIRRKSRIASNLGISKVFLCYPEVSDIIHELVR